MGEKLPGRDYENLRLPLMYIGPKAKDYDCPKFTEIQDEGRLVCNMQRVPVLEEVGGPFSLGQSPSIARFVGQELGFMGRNNGEAAQIDALVEHVRDIRHAFATFRGSTDWFGDFIFEPADDDTGRVLRRTSSSVLREERNLGYWLRRLDECLGDDGFAFGGSPSVADASIYFCFGDCCPELRGGPYESGAEPFGNLEATRRALNAYGPRVSKVVERFQSLPGVKEYLSKRDPQVF